MDEYMAYIWIGVAVVMTIAEIGTAQLVSVWFVIGALCAAVTCLFTGNWQIQLIIFVSVSLLTLLVTRPLVKKFKKKVVKVNTNADRMIGEIGVMQNGISEPEEIGLAKVSGSVWSVKTDDPPLEKGDKVKVLSIEGVKLIVEKAE